MRTRRSLICLFTVAACSSTPSTGPNPDAPSSNPDAPRIDAPRPDASVDAPVDAPPLPATVMTVPCPATPAATIGTSNRGDAYDPISVTINVGQIVRFTMPSDHNVAPNDTMSDSGLHVNYSENKCLMFTQAG